MKRIKILIILVLLCFFAALILFPYSNAVAALQKHFMTITFKDGQKQKVELKQPPSNIAKVEYSSSSATPTQPTPSNVSVLLAPYAGSWRFNDSFGVMVLQVSGNRIIGNFDNYIGQIEGKLAPGGGYVTGRWCQEPTKREPDDAGRFKMTLYNNGMNMRLEWTYGDGPEGDTSIAKKIK